MRRALTLVLLALVLAAGVIRLWPRPTPQELSARAAGELLALNVRRPPAGAAADAASGASEELPFWRALLEGPAATRSDGVVTLKLGRVHADPSAARLAAEAAGELLELTVVTPAGTVPLWRAVLDGPAAARSSEGTALKLYGCRHSADPETGPLLEDTYAARLSIAREFRRLAETSPDHRPLTIEGEHTPVAGGANFEVQFRAGEQTLVVTVDRQALEPLSVRRSFRAEPPNDAVARGSLVQALRARAAADPAYQALRIEGEASPVGGGVDLRLEWFGEHQSLVAALPDGSFLRAHRTWPAR